MGEGASIAKADPRNPRAGEALSWSPRRVVQLDQAFRRSRRVFLLRRLFAGAAIVAALALVAAGFVSALGRTGVKRDRLAADDTIRMLSPRFTGRSTDGKLFIVTADEAIRRNAEDSRIELTEPEIGSGKGGTIRARRGVYDLDRRVVDLEAGVELEDIEGNRFTTEVATFRIDDNYARGDRPVNGRGPIGDMSADSFEVIESGRFIKLRGNVRTLVVTDEEREKRNAALALERRNAQNPAEPLQSSAPLAREASPSPAQSPAALAPAISAPEARTPEARAPAERQATIIPGQEPR